MLNLDDKDTLLDLHHQSFFSPLKIEVPTLDLENTFHFLDINDDDHVNFYGSDEDMSILSHQESFHDIFEDSFFNEYTIRTLVLRLVLTFFILVVVLHMMSMTKMN